MTWTEAERIVSNGTTETLAVHLEPWGEMFELSPGSTLRFVARSPKAGGLEVVDDHVGVTVYAWPGCQIAVFLDGAPFYSCDIAVPDLPEGVSVQQFMGVTGLDKLGK